MASRLAGGAVRSPSVLAWAAARWLTSSESAVWMGPATAVIVVQATVYRNLANGARRTCTARCCARCA
jgi:hypothetical protein